MSLLRRTPQESAELQRARSRVAKMSTLELLEWADAAGSGMAKGFQDYRKNSTPESLLEIGSALTALRALTDELLVRGEEAE